MIEIDPLGAFLFGISLGLGVAFLMGIRPLTTSGDKLGRLLIVTTGAHNGLYEYVEQHDDATLTEAFEYTIEGVREGIQENVEFFDDESDVEDAVQEVFGDRVEIEFVEETVDDEWKYP